jgi:hypothetical protein
MVEVASCAAILGTFKANSEVRSCKESPVTPQAPSKHRALFASFIMTACVGCPSASEGRDRETAASRFEISTRARFVSAAEIAAFAGPKFLQTV